MGHMQMENPVVAAGHANRMMFRSVEARKRLYDSVQADGSRQVPFSEEVWKPVWKKKATSLNGR